jgi:hypothetical protein
MIYPCAMNKTTRLMIASLVVALFGCGDDDDDEATALPTEQAVAAAEEAVGETVDVNGEGEPDPCALLTDEVVRSALDVPEAVTLEQRSSLPVARPYCSYTWDKPNAAEIQQEIQRIQQERVQEMMQKMRSGKQVQAFADLGMELPSTSNRVALNFAPPSESADQARAMFESGMALLQDGITQTVDVDQNTEGVPEQARREIDGQEVTIQADLEEVEGIGDDARWAPRLNQLSVLDGTRILHLTVEMDVDRSVNLEKAKTLMGALLRSRR